jgi:sugar (pentulose or hexulose) kinase
MTGEQVVDENLAGMSGFYSPAEKSWWAPALEAAGVSVGLFPRVIPIGGIAGSTGAGAGFLGLPEGVPVVLAGNDQTAGAYGAGLEGEGGLLITLGTAQVAYLVEPFLSEPASGRIRGPYPDGKAYRMAADSSGGSVVNWVKTVLAGCGTDAEFSACGAGSPPGARGLVFDIGLPEGHGAWRQMGFHHHTGDMARAVIEALCRSMAKMLGELGISSLPSRVLVAGGGSESPLWRGALESKLGVRLQKTEASPLVGAARMAWRGIPGSTE